MVTRQQKVLSGRDCDRPALEAARFVPVISVQLANRCRISWRYSTVGMPVTRHPPCSPGRAVFPHPVPRLYSHPRCKAVCSCEHPPSFGLRDTRPCYLDSIEALRELLPGKTLPLPASSIAPCEHTAHGPLNKALKRASVTL